MDTLGFSLIVGGMAFLCSGMVFLLPTEREISSQKKSVQISQKQIEFYLRQMRNQRGEL
jgi:hypothetical protein